MTPPPEEDEPVAARYQREDLPRTAPKRNLSRMVATPDERETGAAPAAAPPGPTEPADPGPRPADFVENGVQSGYQVFEDYMRRGEAAAEGRASSRASNPYRPREADMSDTLRRLLSGLDSSGGAQDLARMWIRGWVKAMEVVVGPLGSPEDLANASDVKVSPVLERMVQEAAEDGWAQQSSAPQSSEAQGGAQSRSGWRTDSANQHDINQTANPGFVAEESWEYTPETDPESCKRRGSRTHKHRTRTVTDQLFAGIELVDEDKQPVPGAPAAVVELFHHVRLEVQVTKLRLRASTTAATVESLKRKEAAPRTTLPHRTLELDRGPKRWVLSGSLPASMAPGEWEAKIRDRTTGRFTGELELLVQRADEAASSR